VSRRQTLAGILVCQVLAIAARLAGMALGPAR
jgi:hypothetical protein